ncbi:NADPH-dependent F420 reductase [Pseudoclavibacter helvolus]|uniref:NADPH-dependent F420 reductase n=1 Tax=Pseudoclavibacter helvolus TaxID=255205 RepID=UPI0008389000|nr:NAD(P)-binding domain-containing protein [Pseudoclavibacter helvolus]MDN5546473.1 NAD(P)-binding domain-containing protein [Rhodococcus sp. (in: high G+C Gram-positive bacteria)]
MTTIGVLGAGQAGTTFSRAAAAAGYDIVIANTRGPHTLHGLVEQLGPRVRAATADEAAAAADIAFLAFPYAPDHVLPAKELAGKIVIDNNNYMVWRDGHYPEVDSGGATIQELRQRQLPGSTIVKAFSHIQFHGRVPLRVPSDAQPALIRLARPNGAPDRKALVVSSDSSEAVDFVTRLYDDLGFDTVDNSPLAESWRSSPGTPMWAASVDGQSQRQLAESLRRAVR